MGSLVANEDREFIQHLADLLWADVVTETLLLVPLVELELLDPSSLRHLQCILTKMHVYIRCGA
jgi:hypothetical protein